MIKALSKVCLCLLLSISLYKSRAENGQKSCVELIDMQGQGLSDKDHFNILRARDIDKGNERAEVGIGQGNTRVGYPA